MTPGRTFDPNEFSLEQDDIKIKCKIMDLAVCIIGMIAVPHKVSFIRYNTRYKVLDYKVGRKSLNSHRFKWS